MEVPVWAIAAFGVFTTALLAILGYLIRSIVGDIQQQGDETREALKGLSDELKSSDRRVGEELARIDKRFVEEQLAQSRMFVDREVWTRDYVTLTSRLDGLHKRFDRMERDRFDREPPTAQMRRPRRNDTDSEPPDGA
jgi:hypothetical protein